MSGDRLEVDPSSLARLNRLGEAFKASEKDVRTSIRKGLEESAKTLDREVPRKGAEKMPRAGGLRARLAAARGSVAVSMSGSRVTVSIRMRTREGYSLAKIDQGTVIHPVFKNRSVWVGQRVPARAFSDAFKAGLPSVRTHTAAAVQSQLDELARKA